MSSSNSGYQSRSYQPFQPRSQGIAYYKVFSASSGLPNLAVQPKSVSGAQYTLLTRLYPEARQRSMKSHQRTGTYLPFCCMPQLYGLDGLFPLSLSTQ